MATEGRAHHTVSACSGQVAPWRKPVGIATIFPERQKARERDQGAGAAVLGRSREGNLVGRMTGPRQDEGPRGSQPSGELSEPVHTCVLLSSRILLQGDKQRRFTVASISGCFSWGRQGDLRRVWYSEDRDVRGL